MLFGGQRLVLQDFFLQGGERLDLLLDGLLDGPRLLQDGFLRVRQTDGEDEQEDGSKQKEPVAADELEGELADGVYQTGGRQGVAQLGGGDVGWGGEGVGLDFNGRYRPLPQPKLPIREPGPLFQRVPLPQQTNQPNQQTNQP